MSVEHHWVKIDVFAVAGVQHQTGGKSRPGGRSVAEAQRTQGGLRGLEGGLGDDEVEIVVRAGLFADQRVDAPAPIDPTLDLSVAQTIEHSKHRRPRH